jgi:AraC-like DNA-binding protein
MGSAAYTPGEVVYLLSLSPQQARDASVRWADSVGSMSADGPAGSSAGGEHDPVLLIARWHDVRAARRRVIARKEAHAAEAEAILALRLAGATTRAVAGVVGLSYPTVHRRFRATVDEVLAELGADVSGTEATSRVAACLMCGTRPRVGTGACAPCTAAGDERRARRRQARREARARIEAELRAASARRGRRPC